MNYTREQIEEIREALSGGSAWTNYRPFYSLEEKVGAMKCGVCGKPSTQVSYSTGFAGRIAACDKHASL